MTAADARTAKPRAPWSDLRFVVGIVLVVASVVGVWLVIAASRHTVPVFAASRTIVPGEPVDADALVVVDVALGIAGDAYAAPGALERGAVATRTIEKGELVPLSALGAAAASEVTTVVLASATDVPASVGEGSAVEIWSAPALDRGAYDEPRILVPDATVVRVTRDDAVIGQSGASLEVVIPRADIPATLSAIAGGAALSVVPVAGAAS